MRSLGTETVSVIKEQPLVSVIMNCFNGEKYLRAAINSVYAQTYKNWEIIFWDNQSTDNSKEIFKSYDDGRLKYYYAPKHTLLYEARNKAIEKASGELFSFLDVDDWWVPEKLEKQITLFDDPEVGLVYGNYWFVNELKNTCKKYSENKLPTGSITNDLLSKNVVALSTIVFRRVVFNSLDKQFDSNFNIIGDFDLVIRLSLRYKLDCVQEPISYYRYHGNNTSIKQKDILINELEVWIDVCSTDYKEIYNSSKFKDKQEYLLYLKTVNFIGLKKYKKALQIINKINNNYYKFRLLIILVLPKFILDYIKS